MHSTSARAALAGALILAAACGDDPAARLTPEGKEPEVKTLTAEQPENQPRPTEGSSAPAMTREEARQREILATLSLQLKQAGEGLERADILGKLKEIGASAKPLWQEVVASLKDPESLTRAAALEAAAAIDPVAARPHLEQALTSDVDAEVRQKAAEAWGNGNITELAPLFEQVTEETDGQVQMAIMRTVEKVGRDFHVPQVAKVLDQLDMNAAKPAVRFLGAQKAKDQIPKLIEMFNWRDPELRAEVARALGAMETKTKPVFEALVRALEDDEIVVRQGAIEALKSLTGQTFDFVPSDPPEERAAVVDTWKEWLARQD